MNSIQKRSFAFLLAVILCFAQEIPAYAGEIPALIQRIDEKRQEEIQRENAFAAQEALFASKETVTLSGDSVALTTKENPTDWDDGEQTSDRLRMPELDPRTNPDLTYGTPIEVARNYRTYQNPDGTYTTVFTSYPNTYTDGTGEKIIDNTLVSENNAYPQTYTNKQNEIQVVLPAGENPDNTVTVDDGETRARLCPEDGNYTMETLSENAIRYNNVYENVDVQYTVQPHGLKQDIILTAPQERTDFTYTLDREGIRAELKDNMIYIYEDDSVSANAAKSGRTTVSENNSRTTVSENAAGSEEELPAMMISAPQMEDAAGITSDAITLGIEETEDSYRITISADPQWIQAQERAYPIKIDPDVTVLQTEIDQFTISSLGGADRENIYSCCGFFDGLGKTRTYIITTFLYQGIAGGKKDIEILSANLDVYQLSETTGFDIRCYRLNESLYYQDITWDNSVNIDRYAAGEDISKPAGKGWHSFDVRDSVNGWFNGTYESHGLVLMASDETQPGAVFATENYPDSAYAPSLTVNWQEAGDIPADYGLDDTTVNLRPMTLTTTDGKMQCYGVFADGIAKPGAVLKYELSDEKKGYNGTLLLSNRRLYPDSSAFQDIFPAGTIRYKDAQSNWQTPVPFTEFDYDTPYTVSAQAAYRDKQGSKTTSDEFLIYRVTRYDTMQKIADYYGVPLAALLFDNKAADTLLVENNTLFIRNPQKNKDTPYQPAELTDQEKSEIDSALLGRALHCEFGFEPVNLNTGNFYLAQEDFSYSDALGTFALKRSYNTRNAGRMGSFGRGFTSLFDESLGSLSDGTIIYNREDGSSLYFHPDGKGGYETPEGYQLSLTRTKTGQQRAEFSDGERTYDIYRYDITREDKSVVTFDHTGNLLQIKQQNGAVLTFDRDSGGHLVSMTREGVTMPVTTNREGCITSVTMPNGGTFHYGYDSNQNLTSVTDPMGGTKRFTYDSDHRMSAWYDENNVRIVQNTYDKQNRVTAQIDELGGRITLKYGTGKTEATDANGNTTVYEYDDRYRTTAIRYADGTVETKQYKDNLLTGQTDRAGVHTAYVYDGLGNITRKTVGDIQFVFTYDGRGNLTETVDPLSNTVKAEYDARDNLIKTVDEEGNTTAYAYDGRNRLIQKTDTNGNITAYHYTGNYVTEIRINGRTTGKYAYNALGQAVSYTDGEGNTTSYGYDVMGRNTALKTPEGNTTTVAYGKTGLVQSITDANGGTTSYTYDNSNNILSATDPLGNRCEYTYDANGNRLSQKDPEGNTTYYAYDNMDRPVKTTDSEGGITVYTYDNQDNIISEKDPLGNQATAVYDPYYGQIVTYVDEEGTRTDYQYDAGGNLLSVTKDGALMAAYNYDAKGQVVRTELAGGLAEMQEYDANGNCILKTDSEGRKAVFEYDDENRLIRETTAGGYEYQYHYDGAGNLVMVTAPGGITQTYTYDGDGNVLTETDGEGNTTSYTYDGNGNLIAETLPDKTQFHFIYDALNRLASSADGRDYLTAYEYDKTGNLTGITDPLKQKTVYEWDSLGRNTRVTDAMGRETLYTYDADGNLLSETAPDGGVTTYTYDKKGRLTGSTDALDREMAYEYDAFDRIVKETDALGAVTRYEYDVAGNLTAQIDPMGSKTVYEYDLYGNLLSETDACGNRTEYEYDSENRLTAIEDAEGNRASMSYDGVGNLILVKDPLGATERYTYDKAGRLVKEQSADGGVTAYTYDQLGNVTAMTDSLLRTTEYRYDSEGNLIKIINPKGNEISYSYDARNRQISMTHEDGSKDLYAYDAADNLIAVKEGGERITEYAYDVMDRCVAVTDALGNKTSYEYDLCGNLTGETAPDGSRTAYEYDPVNRLSNRTLADGGVYSYAYDNAGKVTKVCGPTGLETLYEYDSVGNVTALIQNGGGSNRQKTNYEYNSLNQIVEITDAMGGKTNYTYDKAGNMTEVTCADGGVYRYEYDLAGNPVKTTDAAGLCREYAYDSEGQILSETRGEDSNGKAGSRTYTYSYDLVGNLTSVKDPLGGVTGYAYDERDRLTETVSPGKAVTAYEYDSLSNLTMVTNAEGYRTTYTYDAKGRLTGEDIAGEEHYTYGYDVRDRLIAVEGENCAVTYQYSRTGNLTKVTDGNGQSVSYEYDKAGNLLCSTDALGNRIENTYDENGNLLSRTDPKGNTTTYDYDALNRLVEKETKDVLADASYSYDSMGRLVKMNDVTGESLYTYDAAGRLLSAVNGAGEEISYHYDVYGNITEAVYPDGSKATYTYDALDRMSAVTDTEGKTTSYEYDKDGNLIRVIREDGETRIAYDRLGQITGLVNEYEGNVISVYGYAYDGRGNITNEKIRLYQDGLTVEQQYAYGYDGMSQLIRSELTQLVTDGEGKKERHTVTVTYAYDSAGNRLMMQTEADGAAEKTTYTYDEGGRLITAEDSQTGTTCYTYDAAGNLIKEEGSRTRYYIYDAANRLSAVTDQENLLFAALYDGSDSRVFMMEYMPELIQKETGDGQNGSDEGGAPTATGQNARQAEKDGHRKSDREATARDAGGDDLYAQRSTVGNNDGQNETNPAGNNPKEDASLSEDEESSRSFNAFWYGVLCQAADIILPAPTPFKQWLHNRMGFTDGISVLWEDEIYKTDFSSSADTVRKAGSPFELISQATANTTGKELASEAYRQVSYVNDVTRANEQALVEYVTNGALGNSAISYTYGVQRESYAMTQYAATAGGITEALTSHSSGIYYYTGTGSVSNLISSGGNYAYTYSEYGARTVYRTDADGYTDVTAISYTYEGYGYNGEYTHEALGIQYLRARYYSMGTGTFTSKDTYAGRIESILSQNRYTYVENNPVNFADPSGHAKSGIASALSGIANNLKKGVGAAVNNVKSSVRSGGGNKTGTNKNRQPSGSGGTKDPQRTFLENINIANRGDTFNGADYYSGIVSNASLNALMGNPGGLTFAESIAAKVEAARCIAYARCMNELQQTILMKKKEDGKSKSAPLAVGSSVLLEDPIVHTKPSKGNYYDYRDALGFRESSDRYDVASGTHMGRFQLGKAALIDIGFMNREGQWTEKAAEYGVYSDQDFFNSPGIQETAFDMFVDVQRSYVQHYELDQYIGQEMNGVTITESGLVAAMHLVGIGSLITALEMGDLTSEHDNNGTTAREYMDTFGGYDLDEIK